MKRPWMALLFIIATGLPAAQTPCSPARWNVDLVALYKFHPFGLPKGSRHQYPSFWKLQQGIAFVSPETLAVYQVVENPNVSEVQPKDASGGAGRYALQVVFLSAGDGKELHTLRITTDGKNSRLYPTHDGKFLLRTGEIPRVYSTNFQKEVEQSLPHSLTATMQGSMVSVSPSGRVIYIRYDASYPTQGPVRGYALLDADTLQTITDPTTSDLALWPEGPGREIFATQASPSDWPGWFTLLGTWQRVDFLLQDNSCYRGFHRITPEVFGVAACNHLRLFSPEGQLFWDAPYRGDVAAVRGGNALIAASFHHIPADPLDLGLAATPLGIKIYDWQKKSQVCFIPPSSKRFPDLWPYILYDVSQQDAVAVIQGNELSLYHP